MPDEPRRDFVQSLERGLAVIRSFDAEHPELSLSDVARRTGLTRAAARRFLLTLATLGYVHTDGRLFSLRPRLLELGHAYLSTLGLDEVAAPHLEALVADLRESSSVAVLDGDDVAYVARVPTKRIMTVSIAVGTRFPAYATSMGRVLLAALPADELDAYLTRARLEPLTRHTVTRPPVLRQILADVAARGHAVVNQELEEGLRSAAAPLRDRNGAVVAAINVSTHSSRTTLDTLRRVFVPRLLETAAAIEADLAAMASGPPGPVR